MFRIGLIMACHICAHLPTPESKACEIGRGSSLACVATPKKVEKQHPNHNFCYESNINPISIFGDWILWRIRQTNAHDITFLSALLILMDFMHRKKLLYPARLLSLKLRQWQCCPQRMLPVRDRDAIEVLLWEVFNMAMCQNLVPLVNIKIAGKWMFIPLKMVCIGIDPYPYWLYSRVGQALAIFDQDLSTETPKKRAASSFRSHEPCHSLASL